MKKIYECPVMMAEVYETNAYCSSCGTSFKTGTLSTDAQHAKSSNYGTGWTPGLGFTEENLTHTFNNSVIFETSKGLCGSWESDCDNQDQSIWKCTCTDHPGETWYLEWSHYYSVHVNHNDTFFLYKERTNNNSFDILQSGDQWPAQLGNSDYNVAQVVYTENESVVVNS